jgi:hypothetical protein
MRCPHIKTGALAALSVARALLALACIGMGSAMSMLGAAHAADPCDRSCLQGLADQLLTSMVAHDSTSLPLARGYAATENSVASALSVMVLWRTVTAAGARYLVIDPQSGQVFVLATLSEGPNDTLLFGRLKVQDRLITEVELYSNRSRGQGGFQFDPDGPSHLPAAWTVAVAPERRASRAQLLQAGRSIFDTSLSAPEVAPNCLVMENGKVVAENPEVLKSIGPSQPDQSRAHRPDLAANPDGGVPVPCGNPPNRPTDRHARTSIIDQEQGVVVSLAVIRGVAEPYLVTQPTVSAFVPDALLAPYADMLRKQQASGKYRAPALRQMPETAAVAELHRIYDGKLQGLHLLVNLGAPGSRSPWVSP